MQTTVKQYLKLGKAYDFFNNKFFDNKLPGCLITLQREKKTKGYYSPGRFKGKHDEGKMIDEIALNPDLFGRSEIDILSTLVHEMVHQWNECFGKKSRRAYHNRTWAGKMEEIGLMPSSSGSPGGEKTGQSVTHYIIEGGQFDNYINELLEEYIIDWYSENHKDVESYKTVTKKRKPGDPFTLSSIEDINEDSLIHSAGVFYNIKKINSDTLEVEVETVKGRDNGDSENSSVTILKSSSLDRRNIKSKTVYVCARCKIKVWGKPDLLLICGSCYKKGDGVIYLNND